MKPKYYITNLILIYAFLYAYGCSVPYTPRGVDFNRWDNMSEQEKSIFIAELRVKSHSLVEIRSNEKRIQCPMVGMIHGIGNSLDEAKARALDWAVLLNGTHFEWDTTTVSGEVSEIVHDISDHKFIMGIVYKCD